MELSGCRSGNKLFSVFVVALLPVYAWDRGCAREECKLNLAWLVQCPYQNDFAMCLGEQQADLGGPCVTGLGVSVLLVRDSGG